jgi:hypothetical protein
MTGVTMASEHEDLHGYYDALNEAEKAHVAAESEGLSAALTAAIAEQRRDAVCPQFSSERFRKYLADTTRVLTNRAALGL